MTKMKKISLKTIASTNLMGGGLVVIITAAYIAVGKPNNLVIFMTQLNSNHVMVAKILGLIGSLSTLLGYNIRE